MGWRNKNGLDRPKFVEGGGVGLSSHWQNKMLGRHVSSFTPTGDIVQEAAPVEVAVEEAISPSEHLKGAAELGMDISKQQQAHSRNIQDILGSHSRGMGQSLNRASNRLYDSRIRRRRGY
jgi:hypothetical protein